MEEPTLTEGEVWARDELACLRRRRFTPPAIGGFLIASGRRSAAVRSARPGLARQSRGWMAAGAGAWAVLALAGVQPFRRRLWGGLGWWAATSAMLDWHLGMMETEDGHPRSLGPADALTLTRAWLVPVAADLPSPLVCAAAAATDVFDGRLARGSAPTRAGRDLEGLVDACFAVAALRGARRREWIGRVVVGAELTRLAAGFGYTLYVYFGQADSPDPAVTRAARVTTPVRAAGLIAAGARHRRLADLLVAGGAAWSVFAVVRALHDRGLSPGAAASTLSGR